MEKIALQSLPILIFAHKFSAEKYYAHHVNNSKNQMEISVITEGSLTFECDGKREIAEKGDILCRYNNDVIVDAKGSHTHHTVCFFTEIAPDPSAFHLPPVTHASESTHACLHLIDKIIQASILTPENTLKSSGLFIQLLGELEMMQQKVHTKCTPGELRYVERTKKYIYDHIEKPISQNDIAVFLGITPEYLCYVFKKSEGCSVIRFINEIKLTRIRLLMENNHLPLCRAAMQYGFSDPNYVSKLYKKYYRETITDAMKHLKKITL